MKFRNNDPQAVIRFCTQNLTRCSETCWLSIAKALHLTVTDMTASLTDSTPRRIGDGLFNVK